MCVERAFNSVTIWQKCGSGSPTPSGLLCPYPWVLHQILLIQARVPFCRVGLKSNLKVNGHLYDSHTTIVPEQWSSAFWILQPFNTVPYVVVTPNQKIIFYCCSITVMLCYSYESSCKYLCFLFVLADPWERVFFVNPSKGSQPGGWEPLY